MNYYLKAWLSAATLPLWMASSIWFDTMKVASTPLKLMERSEETQ